MGCPRRRRRVRLELGPQLFYFPPENSTGGVDGMHERSFEVRGNTLAELYAFTGE